MPSLWPSPARPSTKGLPTPLDDEQIVKAVEARTNGARSIGKQPVRQDRGNDSVANATEPMGTRRRTDESR